ncbi:uncharacterized protein METZ01_LOCUS418571, partial [marine metagenome]
MKKRNKSFYFEDYTESKILEKEVYFNIVKVSYSRITFLSFIFLSLVLTCSIKMIYLSLASDKFFYAQNVKNNFLKNRRDIVDRNGTVLATDVNLYDVGVRPKLLKDIEKKNLLIKLGLLFPDLDLEILKKKLNKNNFFWLGKRLTPQEKDQLWLIGNKAFEF